MIRVSLLHMIVYTSAILRSWNIQEDSEHQFRLFLAVSERWVEWRLQHSFVLKRGVLFPFSRLHRMNILLHPDYIRIEIPP